jgi:predicted enzyme related to lactoylglutathione lyase
MLARRSGLTPTAEVEAHVVAMRYLVEDVGSAVDFYVEQLGFVEQQRFGAAMAVVERDGLQLWLAGPASSAARPMPDGRRPEPGGWNRLVIAVDDLEQVVGQLREAGAAFRNEPISGPGGHQVLVEDPSGNPVELFEPR